MNDNSTVLAVNVANGMFLETAGRQYLTFRLSDETYGVEISQVQEIKAWMPLTKLPNAPRAIKGVLNLRGKIVPILDMRTRFNMEKLDHTSSTVIIILALQDQNHCSRTVGIVVDSVSDVVDINDENIKPAPELGENVESNIIPSIAVFESRMILLLDTMQIVNKSELDSVLLDYESD